MPLRLTSPTVGLSPATPFAEADRRPIRPSPCPRRRRRDSRRRQLQSRSRSAGIAVERIRVASQSAAAAPSAGGVTGANVGPLTKIGFAQDHDAGRTQASGDESVVRGTRAEQRQRTRRRIHTIPGVDVVLDEDRNAMKRPTRPFRLAFMVECVGDLESVRVQLDHGVDHGSGFVDLPNARQVFLGQRAGGIPAGLECLLGVVNRDLVEFEVFDGDGRRRQGQNRPRGPSRATDKQPLPKSRSPRCEGSCVASSSWTIGNRWP